MFTCVSTPLVILLGLIALFEAGAPVAAREAINVDTVTDLTYLVSVTVCIDRMRWFIMLLSATDVPLFRFPHIIMIMARGPT
ncbi:uncharacterized protein EDB93DRAFT_1248274 [Suillus bovinus]|uniref:uncharacterized protein n=1 Tax=Suillus bovinus TaxID=48563 RepID=UPI001B85C75E|nr:uncharacterized protein EDB93DRAFT_1248274 [Suillus bovinus]KAG2154478.1 hypothetical protein EDB93DRAFT_1248274 [Suillus bovinus]